jgi:hypothetical protein
VRRLSSENTEPPKVMARNSGAPSAKGIGQRPDTFFYMLFIQIFAVIGQYGAIDEGKNTPLLRDELAEDFP